MKLKYFSEYPAEFSEEEFQQVSVMLREQADNFGGAIFGGNRVTQVAAVCFCGVNERFRTISLLRCMNVSCVIFQDANAPWFTGSDLCDSIDLIVEKLGVELPSVEKWIVFGQSSGGYAALYMSCKVAKCVSIAFSPQTFDDRLVAHQIGMPDSLCKSYVQSKIVDLKDLFRDNLYHNPAFIVSSVDEHENPRDSFVWLDHMHWSRLLEFSYVRVFLMETRNHSLLYKKGEFFSKLLQELTVLGSVNIDETAGYLVKRLYSK